MFYEVYQYVILLHSIREISGQLQFPSMDIKNFFVTTTQTGGWDSVIGIAACYGLDGLGFKPQQGEIFVPIQSGAEADPASCAMDTNFFSLGKASGVWC
jgi:hypothetical protein